MVKLKNDEIKPPKVYLGAKLEQRDTNGIQRWTIGSYDYIDAAITTVKTSLKSKFKDYELPKNATSPMTSGFIPELDDSRELDSDEITFFQEMIGMLRWAIELGQVDILHEVSILLQYQAMPRQGHLEQIFHIFRFLENKKKLTLHMDPDLPNIDYSLFTTNVEDFHPMYRDAKDKLPHGMPKARGRGLSLTAWVDASHGANKVTRRSHTGFVIFLNRAPVMWYSKRQNTVESSAFSSEFIAMKVCIETIQGLRYKLRMFGIPIANDEPGYIFATMNWWLRTVQS